MTPIPRIFRAPVGWWIVQIPTTHGEARIRRHTWADAMRSLARVYGRRDRGAS